MTDTTRTIGRRKLLTGLGTGIAAIGALSAASDAAASPGKRWQPALEKQDDWMDLPGRHRFAFDATSPDGAGEALFFAKNYIYANKIAYGLAPAELANIVILRHMATIFGYNDAVWAKYGEAFAKFTHFMNPTTKQAARRNLYNVAGQGDALPNRGATFSSIAREGVQFAICGLATRKISEILAQQTKTKARAVHEELSGNLVPNGRLVAAGIVAVNRTQERGYALAYIG